MVRTKSLGCICVLMTYTFQSRATQYTNINYELRYCLVRFLNHKGRDLKYELRVLKSRRALVEITEMVSE